MEPYLAWDLREKTVFRNAKLDTYIELLNLVKANLVHPYNYDYTGRPRSLDCLSFRPSGCRVRL